MNLAVRLLVAIPLCILAHYCWVKYIEGITTGYTKIWALAGLLM